MIYILVFIVFFLINTYVFMYQRTTLTITRVIRDKHGIGNMPITKMQMALTPSWMGLLGWISTIGLYGSLILLGWKIGILWALGLLITVHISHAVVPIPSGYFYGLVKKHLQKERDNQKDKEMKEALSELWMQVVMIAKTYKVS